MTDAYTAHAAAQVLAPAERPPLNGFELLAATKVNRGWIVLVREERPGYGYGFPEGFQYVTAHVDHLTSPTWYLGHYFTREQPAREDFLLRAN